jgi:hypothetical protein
LGKLVNSLTARGDIGKAGTGDYLRMFLWAPKMLKGNIDVLTAHGLGHGLTREMKGGPALEKGQQGFLKRQAALNLVKIAGETGAVMAMANALAPGSAEADPRSSRFGKITVKHGKKITTFDLTGGKGSIVTLIARTLPLVGGIKKADGQVVQLSRYGTGDIFDLGLDFLLRKTTPMVSEAVQSVRPMSNDEKDRNTMLGTAKRMLPISVQNFIKNFLGEDPDDDTASIIGSILDLFGISTMTYEPKQTKSKKSGKKTYRLEGNKLVEQ